jgi:hypothetical protein
MTQAEFGLTYNTYHKQSYAHGWLKAKALVFWSPCLLVVPIAFKGKRKNTKKIKKNPVPHNIFNHAGLHF